MTTAVSLSGLTKVYETAAGAQVALDGIDLEVERGEVTLLMGPSGSGKTTLLSTIGCILRPTCGRVTICGTDVQDLDEDERCRFRLSRIGFVFQSYNLLTTLTAEENVRIALELKGVTGRDQVEQARRLLDMVELSAKAGAHPATLSGGQKQRVAIARALAGTPDVILADEPTAALDWQTGRQVLDLFHQLAHMHSRAVVIVTHDARAIEYGDRRIFMRDGRIMPAPRRESMTDAGIPSPALAPSEWRSAEGAVDRPVRAARVG